MAQTPEPTAHDAKRSTDPRTGTLLTTILVLVIALVVIVVTVIVVAIVRSPVRVPSVVGETTRTAEATLADAHLRLGSVEVTANPSLSDSQIVRQHPAAGQDAQRNGAVAVVVNLQPHALAMPDFVGLTGTAAETSLRSYPFSPVVMKQFSDSVPAGRVVSQAPKSGAQWMTGLPVAIEVSLGAGEQGVRVPLLTGKSAAEAATRLKQAGLGLRAISVSNLGIPAGTVFSQLPEADTIVPHGSDVAIFVAGATQ